MDDGESMNRSKLYIDIDGVLLTNKKTRASDFACEFLNYCVSNFDCYWLTTHCKGDNKNVLKYLNQYFNVEMNDTLNLIKSTYWETLKTEAIDFTSDFIWLEDNPFNAEIEILNKNNAIDNLIVINLNNKDELKRVMNIIHKKI